MCEIWGKKLYRFILSSLGRAKKGATDQGMPFLCPEISTASEFLDYSTENTAYMAGLGKVKLCVKKIQWVFPCVLQASELVCNNLDTYHKQMKEVRDYLEEQLSVSLHYISYLI